MPKFDEFVSQPIKDKPVIDLPGVADVFGPNLTKAGFAKAKDVVKQFLRLKGDVEEFKNWICSVAFDEDSKNRDWTECMPFTYAWTAIFLWCISSSNENEGEFKALMKEISEEEVPKSSRLIYKTSKFFKILQLLFEPEEEIDIVSRSLGDLNLAKP